MWIAWGAKKIKKPHFSIWVSKHFSTPNADVSGYTKIVKDVKDSKTPLVLGKWNLTPSFIDGDMDSPVGPHESSTVANQVKLPPPILSPNRIPTAVSDDHAHAEGNGTEDGAVGSGKEWWRTAVV